MRQSLRRTRAELDNRWFGPEDAWLDPQTGRVMDVVYHAVSWVENELSRVLVRHQARVGYSTAAWANVLNSQPLADPSGWFARLQQEAQQPYPEELRQAIIALNLPLLRQAHSSFSHQLAKAVTRGDLVSVNHRLAAFLASYFDVLFALNRVPHPGEKRLLEIAQARCAVLPAALPQRITALLQAAAGAGPAMLTNAEEWCFDLERLVERHSARRP